MMYHLNADGSIATGDIQCTTDDQSYGCTAVENNANYAYPFDSSTITVDIEGTEANNRYLRDVIAQEMSPSLFLQPALNAQAIAARTYAYWHIRTAVETPGPIDNSNAYQVFLPYRYDQFDNTERAAIDTALQPRHYMAYREPYAVNIYGHYIELSEIDPTFAEFFADIREQTLPNSTFPYLKGVPDPISIHPDISANGHGHGMSQNGAGRWARGSQSFQCDPYPAPCEPPPDPLISAWSVQWNRVEQILTHYYTGIHIRDANAVNNILTPNRRWVPLDIFGFSSPSDSLLV